MGAVTSNFLCEGLLIALIIDSCGLGILPVFFDPGREGLPSHPGANGRLRESGRGWERSDNDRDNDRDDDGDDDGEAATVLRIPDP